MHLSTLLSLAAAGALVASMPYNEANQLVDNQGPGMSPADIDGPRDWAKEENLLYDLLIKYRKDLNLPNPEIPRSPSLDIVAHTHANNPFETPSSTCNPHSWPAKKEAKWKSCCYNPSKSETSSCIWDKPRELTTYQGNGYEVYTGINPEVYSDEDTAEACLKSFQISEGGHNDLLINKGDWTIGWEAVGVGMAKGQCAIWFGREKDIATSPGSQTAQGGQETPGAWGQQVGLEKPSNPDPNSNPTPTPTPNAGPTPDNDSHVVTIWTQCGGRTWTGPTACAEGLVCKQFSAWYSQCKPAA